MQMPGRHGFAAESGDWHGSYAFAIPPHLIVNHRGGNMPGEYVASQMVELSDGFSTGSGADNYVAYIVDSASMAALDSAYQLVGGAYRYGFNGQEKDYDNGQNIYTALYWEYDSRSGRRWNIDPVPKSSVSNYIVLGNNPISYVDPLGDNWFKNKNGGYDWKDKKGGKINFWAQGDKKGTAVWYGSNKDDITMSGGPLKEVVVTASKKAHKQDPIRAAFARTMSDFNHTAADEASWKISQDNFRKGNYSAISPQQLKMYQGWKQADKDYRTLSYIFVGGIAAPVVATGLAETGAAYYLYQQYGRRFAVNVFKQTMANNGDIGKIDWFDVGLSTFNPLGNSLAGRYGTDLISSAFDYKGGTFTTVFGHKSVEAFAMDAYFGAMRSTAKFGLNSRNGSMSDVLIDVHGGQAKNLVKDFFGVK